MIRYRGVLRGVELVLLVATTVGLAAVFGLAIAHAFNADVTKCASRGAVDSRTGLILGGVALGGFACGRLVAMGRKWVNDAPVIRDQDRVRTGGPLQGALAAFLVLAAFLLGYETYALANSASAPPITEYVRCAAATSPTLTGVAAFAVALLIGNWLWYPTE